jgi:CHAT domain-containing protein
VSNGLQYRIVRLVRRIFFAAFLSLGIAGAATAKDAPCTDFEAERDALRGLLGEYFEDRDTVYLDRILARSRAARACARTDSDRARTYSFETWALVELHRYDEADQVFEEFSGLTPAQGDSVTWSTMHHRHASILQRLGRFAASQQSYAGALRYGEALPLERRLRLYQSHATALGQMAAYDEALERYERIEALIEAEGDALPADVRDALLGRTLLDQADVLHLRSIRRTATRDADLDRALVTVQRALTVLDGSDYDARKYRAVALLVLGDVLHATGRYDEAEARYREAVRAADAHGELSVRAEAWGDLGEHLLALRRSEEALPVSQQALDLWTESEDDNKIPGAYVDVGRGYEQLGRLDEAEAAFREAIGRTERNRASLGATDLAASAFAARQGPYRRLAGLYLRTGRPREAFALVEQTRARHLHDLRRDRRELVGLPASERARLDSLDTEIERLRAALATEPDPAGLLGARLTELVTERYGPDADAAAYAPPSIEDVQRALGRRGQTLVSYFLADSSTAFVVTAEDFHAVPLGVSEAGVDSLVQAVSTLWRGEADAPSRQAVEFDLDALHALYRAVFAPVRERVEDGAPLVVIPDGRLREVPFAMLLEEPAPHFQYAAAPYLLRRHPITTDLAAALLTDTTGLAADQPLDLLAFGRSDFALPADAPRRDGEAPLPNLPVVRDELRALRSLFRRGVVALDGAAAESDLNRRLPEARVVHLASHATVDPQQPLYSHIELWPDSTEDGRLHLYELAGRHLPAELVVLSGCSTARGQALEGEGMMGLHYGFRAAGSEASLGTLWYVDDEATGALMTRFYRHLRAGLSKDRALQQAQLDYLDAADGLRASPFFWAAPVLYGSPAAIEWTDPPGLSPVAWAGIGGLLLLLGLALPRVWERANGRECGVA